MFSSSWSSSPSLSASIISDIFYNSSTIFSLSPSSESSEISGTFSHKLLLEWMQMMEDFNPDFLQQYAVPHPFLHWQERKWLEKDRRERGDKFWKDQRWIKDVYDIYIYIYIWFNYYVWKANYICLQEELILTIVLYGAIRAVYTYSKKYTSLHPVT